MSFTEKSHLRPSQRIIEEEDSNRTKALRSTTPLLQAQASSLGYSRLRCRVHPQNPLMYICMDQYCDFQRLLCVDCEVTEHFQRHRHRCILVSQLIQRAEKRLEMQNWPQDKYLISFQEYLKAQTDKCDNVVKEMCEKLRMFMEEKIQEVNVILCEFSDQQQQNSKKKVKPLLDKYKDNCANLSGLRQILEDLNSISPVEFEQRDEGGESNCNSHHHGPSKDSTWKNLQIEKEKKITHQVNDYLKSSLNLKQYLNQKYGFGKFEIASDSSHSLIDFPLIQSEFSNIKDSLVQMTKFIKKNACKIDIAQHKTSDLQSASLESQISKNPQEQTSFANEFAPGLSFFTPEIERKAVFFRPNERTVFIQRQFRPSFFFSNILPSQTVFQIHLSGAFTCGMYIGVIDDDLRSLAVNPVKNPIHFVGTCIGCKYEHYGKCKTQGQGLYLDRSIRRQNENCSDSEDLRENFHNLDSDNDDEDLDDGQEMQSAVINVFINLTKKIMKIQLVQQEDYVTFDLDDKNYFYNRNLRFFVQSKNYLAVELVNFTQVK